MELWQDIDLKSRQEIFLDIQFVERERFYLQGFLDP